MKSFFSNLAHLLKLAHQGWTEDNASRLSAALAYYTIFSLAPLLVIVIAVTGLIWDAGAVQAQILGQVQSLVGAEGAEFVAGLMMNTGSTGEGILTLLIGVLTLGDALPMSELLLQIVNLVLSVGVITVLFALIFKFLPNARIAWRDVWMGAFVTSLLFSLGKTVIGIYLGNSAAASTFGAAGSLVLLLLWIYYSAQILYFGAEFTQVYANRYGSKMLPEGGQRLAGPGARERTDPVVQPFQPASPSMTISA